MTARAQLGVVVAVAVVMPMVAAATAHAAPALAALAPAPADDARKAIAVGPDGEVYAPDGKGDWVRSQAIGTADTLALAGRAGASVVALGEGVVYRLAANGWSAIRLVQKGKAVMSAGGHAVAAVGRQLFALDRTANGEPFKLALAPGEVRAIGSGAKAVVIATDAGLFRLDGAAFKRLDRPGRRGLPRVDRLVSDRWALVDRGALDLKTGAVTAWPQGVRIAATAPVTATDDGLAIVGGTRVGLELVTVTGSKVARDAIDGTAGARAVGVVVDKTGRATVALADGRLARRERGTWTVVTVREALPAPKPGSPPATSP